MHVALAWDEVSFYIPVCLLEAGYDVDALKKRGRGRPGRGAEPSQVVALRLTLEEIAALDERAGREGKTRSEVIRDALRHSAA